MRGLKRWWWSVALLASAGPAQADPLDQGWSYDANRGFCVDGFSSPPASPTVADLPNTRCLRPLPGNAMTAVQAMLAVQQAAATRQLGIWIANTNSELGGVVAKTNELTDTLKQQQATILAELQSQLTQRFNALPQAIATDENAYQVLLARLKQDLAEVFQAAQR